jgi:hypothetical protein
MPPTRIEPTIGRSRRRSCRNSRSRCRVGDRWHRAGNEVDVAFLGERALRCLSGGRSSAWAAGAEASPKCAVATPPLPFGAERHRDRTRSRAEVPIERGLRREPPAGTRESARPTKRASKSSSSIESTRVSVRLPPPQPLRLQDHPTGMRSHRPRVLSG